MNDVSKKLEIVTNLAIICAISVFGYFTAQKYFSSGKDSVQPNEVAVGTKILLGETDWLNNRKTLLLIIRKDCQFCSESVPFYKTLVEKTKEKGIKLVAVLPTSREESQIYLKENGVNIQEIRQADDVLKQIVKGTPTLILVNERGEVLNFWKGKLPSEKEKEVLNNL